MTPSSKLSNNLKQVIVGLCTYPMKSDSFIAEKFSVKRSTFATIKRRLLEPEDSSPLLKPINIPNFQALGAELFSFTIAKLNPTALDTIAKSDATNRLQLSYNVINTSIEPTPSRALISLVSKNYTDLTIVHHSFIRFYLDYRLLSRMDLNRFIISLSSGGFFRFLHYSDALSKLWGIELPEKLSSPIFNGTSVDISQISSLGWQIYDTLMKYPGTSIVDLCDMLKKPRNTIARWVKKFQDLDLYKQTYIPDLKALGYNIQLIASVSIQGLNDNDREEIQKLILSHFSPTDLFLTYDKIVFFSIFPDYHDLRQVEHRFFDDMNKYELPFDLDKTVLSLEEIFPLKKYDDSFSNLVYYLRNLDGFSLTPIP